ncbi:endolytic transglycosylase MltG [Patescibacteria group bacterium]|nr:endolytic transglycosylase MltG [Patescibacteria group bacterium]
MKKTTLFLPVIIIFLCSLFIWWSINTKPVSDKQSLETFIITRGSPVTLIGKKLKEEGFVKNSLAFKFYVQFTGKQQKIQAGEYRLSSSWNLFKIVDQFVKGPEEIWVTIPEGLRREEVSERFIKSLGKNSQDAKNFSNEFINLTKDKEGFLFPDTYLFPQMASASAVVNKLTRTFENKVDSKLLTEINKSSFSLKEVITVASLIERETRSDSEKALVAGIIYRRLQAEWPLQIDAAVQYAVSTKKCTQNFKDCDWWTILTKEDIQINSAFNTYKNTGLPPQPISNPGISSINAAIYPETSPYWFYLHDSKGEIHYAKTIEEHNANIVNYLK